MKSIILAIMAVAVLSGCGGGKPVPAGRLQQPAGDFSFVTPDGWFRSRIAGIDFIVVSGAPDLGTSPNLFVDFVRTGSIGEIREQVMEQYRKAHRSYEVVQEDGFTTDSGLPGIRITARRETHDALPLAGFHYLIQDGERVIVVTATCADPASQKYEPLFEKAMRSLESTSPTRPEPGASRR